MWASGPDRKRGWSSGPTDRRSPSVPRPLRRGPGTVGGEKSGIASFKSWMSNHENLDVNHRKLEFNHQKWELNSSTMTSWTVQPWQVGCQPAKFDVNNQKLDFNRQFSLVHGDSLLIDGNWNGIVNPSLEAAKNGSKEEPWNCKQQKYTKMGSWSLVWKIILVGDRLTVDYPIPKPWSFEILIPTGQSKMLETPTTAGWWVEIF